MSNKENIAVDQLHDLINDLKKREDIHKIGLALQELGRRVVYRVDVNAGFADLNEEDQERARAALAQVGKVGYTDA